MEADDEAQALARLESLVPTLGLRSDGAATCLAVGRALVAFRYARTRRAIVGHARLAAVATGLRGRRIARSTAGAHVQRLVDAGWIAVAAEGYSKAITGVRDVAPEYAFVMPVPGDREWTEEDEAALAAGLAHLREGVDGNHPVGVSDLPLGEIGPGLALGAEILEKPMSRRPARAQRPERYVPRTVDDSITGALVLLMAIGWTFGMGRVRQIAATLRAFFAEGWTPEALHAATQRYPDGRRQGRPLNDAAGIFNRGAVLWARLKPWTVPDPTRPAGWRPLPPPIPGAVVRRGPQPAWLRAEQDEQPRSVTLPAATVPPTAAQRLFAAAGLRPPRVRHA